MAETRETQVLEDVVESTEIENPRTTEEAILAKIIAGEEVNINARTRYQAYLKELSSISGGNPNYVETIEGTLANPWGTYTSEDIADSVLSENMSVYIVADASALGLGSQRIYAQTGGIADGSFPFGATTASSDGQTWRSIYTVYDQQSSQLTRAYALINGSAVDLMQYASLIPTSLTIIHHPLPEDNT